ncbi:hypothetical protein FACS189468_1770 [Spirochaetia bacterium]|nr:hypothetical protein FACS189468_1770 [Spirochaetia bacterium]
MVRAHGFVIHLTDFGSDPSLGNQFDSGKEIIQERAEGAVDTGEGLPLGGGVEAGIA